MHQIDAVTNKRAKCPGLWASEPIGADLPVAIDGRIEFDSWRAIRAARLWVQAAVQS